MALRRQLRLPAGLYYRSRRLLADDRGAGDAVAGQHGIPVEHRGVVRPPVHVGRYRRELRKHARRCPVGAVRLPGLGHHADAFDRRRFDDQPLLRHGEAVSPVVRVLEARLHLLRRSEVDGVGRVAPLVADVCAAQDLDALIGDVLIAQLRLGLIGEIVERRRKFRHQRVVQRRLDGPLPERPDVGETHAVGGEHAGEGMDQHRRHAERVSHQASVLAARATETVQSVAGHVVAALHGDLLDRVRHVLDRDLEKARGNLGGRALVARGLSDLRRQSREFLAHHAGVQRLVLAGAEDVRKELGLQRAQHDVAVGDAERPAPPVARGARIGARRLRPHAIARAIEEADRAAARRHRMDQHHRRAHAHAGHQGLEGALVFAVVVRDIGRRAAHVEGDDLVEAGLPRRLHRADDAPGRPAQDRVLALEERGVGQAPARLHEHEPCAAKLCRYLVDVAPQQGREVRIDHGGIAAAHQLHQRAGLVAR